MTPDLGIQTSPSPIPRGTITNVQRYSLHDGGGIRTVAFLKGCPFTCPWCCNPENLSRAPEVSFKERLCINCSPKPDGRLCTTAPEDCPTGAKELLGVTRGVEDLAQELLRDKPFFDESGGGVTLSGGECLEWQEFVVAVLERCHELGTRTAIETTMALPLRDAAALVHAVDAFLVDFKIADRARSLEVLRLDTSVRDANLRTLLGLGAAVVARLPIIPGYTDSRENVEANARRIAELGITRADVLPFHQLGESKYETVGRTYDMGAVEQLHDEDVQYVVDLLEAEGISTTIHGE